MKCEHCGKNEANFFYKSNINGKMTQVHLCQDCAEALGYTQSLRKVVRPMSLFEDDFFLRPFSMLEPFFSSRLLTEFPEPGKPTERKSQPGLVDEGQQEKLRKARKRNALQAQMKAAIETENFEEAARLRDELKQLPQQ